MDPEWKAQTSLSAVFGRVLALLRQEKGVTQREFRKLAKMKPGAIERLETGLATATLPHLYKVSRGLRSDEKVAAKKPRPAVIEVGVDGLLKLLDDCARELGDRGFRVYMEGPAKGEQEEMDAARLDRVIGVVVEAWLEGRS
jgi:transcriptional regulator with XRE-family HTH domain